MPVAKRVKTAPYAVAVAMVRLEARALVPARYIDTQMSEKFAYFAAYEQQWQQANEPIVGHHVSCDPNHALS